jgi:flagellar P-ring protein precursor FlgI
MDAPAVNVLRRALAIFLAAVLAVGSAQAARIKELARVDGDREHRLIGYGLVVGLSGSGDSDRNRATRLALANALTHFQVTVNESEILSRNTAAVIVTSAASAWGEAGDRLDVQVSSLGDARSLQGGTLMLTPLYGADEKLYALAQGPLTTGSFSFEMNATSVQRNHPTVGMIARGAILERAVTVVPPAADAAAHGDEGQATAAALILNTPDLTTAARMQAALGALPEISAVRVVHPGKITFSVETASVPLVLAKVEALEIAPDQPARLVVNERTGTLVAGGDIRLGRAVIAQDDLRIAINTSFRVSQPFPQFQPGDGIATVTVPESAVDVRDDTQAAVIAVDDAATVLDLVNALRNARVPAKSMVSIFQSLRAAGALNAQIVVQ